MIRPAKENREMSDDDYFEIIEPSDKEIRDYLYNEFIYEFVAKCIATDYKNDAIWADSTLEFEYSDARDFLSNMPYYNKIDKEKLIKTLEEKYSLKITNTDPIEIEEINN